LVFFITVQKPKAKDMNSPHILGPFVLNGGFIWRNTGINSKKPIGVASA